METVVGNCVLWLGYCYCWLSLLEVQLERLLILISIFSASSSVLVDFPALMPCQKPWCNNSDFSSVSSAQKLAGSEVGWPWSAYQNLVATTLFLSSARFAIYFCLSDSQLSRCSYYHKSTQEQQSASLSWYSSCSYTHDSTHVQTSSTPQLQRQT